MDNVIKFPNDFNETNEMVRITKDPMPLGKFYSNEEKLIRINSILIVNPPDAIDLIKSVMEA